MFTAHSHRKQQLSRGGESFSITSSNQLLFLMGKRFFDVTASLVLGALALLPMIVLAVIIRIESPGPAIFRQHRLGKDGKEFIMYKLRSMHIDAEKDGPQLAKEHDNRCTRLGNFLRRSHFDELPQLWNVIKNDMSLVGPRPERAYFYEEISENLPEFRQRLAVKPGLTGWAQVQGGYHISAEQKLEYDRFYMSNMSWKLDIYCILLTVRQILREVLKR